MKSQLLRRHILIDVTGTENPVENDDYMSIQSAGRGRKRRRIGRNEITRGRGGKSGKLPRTGNYVLVITCIHLF